MSQAATQDIAKAYRTIPVHPDHKCLIVFQHPQDVFYLDHCVPFGLGPAAGMQGEPADAVIDILVLSKIPSTKWVDDLGHLRYPTGRDDNGDFVYAYDLQAIRELLAPLGIPWHESKFSEFADEVDYVGFRWNVPQKTVALPEHKRVKYVAKLRVFEYKARTERVTLREVESMVGTLSHVCFVYRDGRSYLAGLFKMASGFGGNMHAVRFATSRVVTEIAWWMGVLQQTGIHRSLVAKQTLELGIWTDASEAWGVGVIFDGQWDAWRLSEGWKVDGRDIGWAETVGLELAILAIQERGLVDVNVYVNGDNTGSIGAYKKGRGRNEHTNYAVRRMHNVARACNVDLEPRYVRSEDNLADSISRGRFGAKEHWANFRFDLPAELQTFLEHVHL